MRLHWFSPAPPAHTDIANYSLRVVRQLAGRHEITWWFEAPPHRGLAKALARELGGTVACRAFQGLDLPWHEINRGDLTIYQMGNNAGFHATIHELARRHPGLLVMHDACLYNLYEALADRQGFKTFVEDMRYLYGDEGARDAQRRLDHRAGQKLGIDAMAARYPCFEPLLDGALGVITHVEGNIARFRPHTSAPIACLPLAYRQRSEMERAPRESATPRPEEPYRIVIFGFMSGTSRRLLPFLEAFGQFPERHRFEVGIYGDVDFGDQLRETIERLGLAKRVRHYGYVAEARLEQALAGAALCINLRYPVRGEGSGSMLRIWSHALPAMVTRAGWFAEQPEEALAFVRPDHEREDIQSHLASFLREPATYRQKGEAGYRLLQERHTVESYVEQMEPFLEEAIAYRREAWRRCLVREAVARIHGSSLPVDGERFLSQSVAAALAPPPG